jgi:hypothetical protein
MIKLNALVQRVSDTAFIALTLCIFGTLICVWYLLWYEPLKISVAALTKQITSVQDRSTSLKKRLDKSHSLPQEFEALEYKCAQESQLLKKEPEALAELLTRIKESGATLLTWKPCGKQEYYYVAQQLIECELIGSYEQLLTVFEGNACQELMLTKTVLGIHCRSVFGVLFRRDL